MDKPTDKPEGTPPGLKEVNTLNETEQAMERGFLAVHSQISENFSTLFQVAATATGLVNLLVLKNVIDGDEVTAAIADAGNRIAGSFGNTLKFFMYPGKEDKRTVAGPPIDCASRAHLCRTACCALDVAMSTQDVEEGKLRIEVGHPYQLRRGPNGYCCHHAQDGQGCTVYDDRPVICRKYTCTEDARIWTDFEKRIPNVEGIDHLLSRARAGRLRVVSDGPRNEKLT